MSVKSKLTKLAAEMVLAQNMPSRYHEDWDWPKGMQVTSWRKVYDSSSKAHEQCRQWGVALKQIIDSINNDL